MHDSKIGAHHVTRNPLIARNRVVWVVLKERGIEDVDVYWGTARLKRGSRRTAKLVHVVAIKNDSFGRKGVKGRCLNLGVGPITVKADVRLRGRGCGVQPAGA